MAEFERLGVPRCRVIVTVPLHPDHPDWFDLSFVYWGFCGHESIKSAALRVLIGFCDHNPTVVALSPFGLFSAVSPHDPAWLDRMDHLQGLCYTTASVIGKVLESARLDWHNLSATYQQLSFTLAQTQQENDRLCAKRFQLELERGDRLQRIVDLEAKITTLQEDVDADDIERLTLLQNITEM
jgi:hypothetical protein